jgi:hypothetical protein
MTLVFLLKLRIDRWYAYEKNVEDDDKQITEYD